MAHPVECPFEESFWLFGAFLGRYGRFETSIDLPPYSSLVLNNDTVANAAEEDDSLAMMYGVKRHATPESGSAASNKKGPAAASSSPGLNSTLASAVENTPTTGKQGFGKSSSFEELSYFWQRTLLLKSFKK